MQPAISSKAHLPPWIKGLPRTPTVKCDKPFLHSRWSSSAFSRNEPPVKCDKTLLHLHQQRFWRFLALLKARTWRPEWRGYRRTSSLWETAPWGPPATAPQRGRGGAAASPWPRKQRAMTSLVAPVPAKPPVAALPGPDPWHMQGYNLRKLRCTPWSSGVGP